MTIAAARKALKQYFGYDSFRPMQADIIQRVLDQQDAVVLMPTGGGKSICFQIPALVMDGVGVIVSPLIALMQDQVEGLKANGVRAEFINSSRSGTENMQVIHRAMDGELDLLYVSPEKLLSQDFLPLLRELPLALFAIDEAHCISAWGHDFRPEYAQLAVLKQNFSKVPVIALTATADKLTRRDIVQRLGLHQPELFTASFDRPNLSLQVLPGRNRLGTIVDWIEARPNQSGIIYCLSRKNTEDVAAKLKAKGIAAKFYHAGMGPKIRAKVQQEFIRDDIQIICATIAFGMGIDKSNIRWVIHYNLPKNIEGYYQEIGRAGRDGLPSDTLLFYSYADVIQLQRFIEESGQPEVGMMKLERMQQFANAKVCRRRVLLSYFGEHQEESCKNCDVCENPPETFDGTVMSQKALSAMMRMKERVGMNMVVDVLRGSGRREILMQGYDKIKTYGAGSATPRSDWLDYLMQMLDQGLIEMAYDEGNALKVTEVGKQVLFEGKGVELVKKQYEERKKAVQDKKKKGQTVMDKVDEALFQKLRTRRKALADKKGIPPYLIFHDATLKAMATAKPISRHEMRTISGVGDRKLQLYADPFINEILGFLQKHPSAKPEPRISPVVTKEKKKRKKGEKKKPTREVTYELYLAGKSVEEIAEEREIKAETIYSHLALLFADGQHEIDLFKFMTVDELQRTLAAIQSVGKVDGLKPIYDALDGQIDYHKIRFAIAYRQRQLTSS